MVVCFERAGSGAVADNSSFIYAGAEEAKVEIVFAGSVLAGKAAEKPLITLAAGDEDIFARETIDEFSLIPCRRYIF